MIEHYTLPLNSDQVGASPGSGYMASESRLGTLTLVIMNVLILLADMSILDTRRLNTLLDRLL